MSDPKACSVIFVKRKNYKKIGICCGNRGAKPLWFILYSIVLCNFSWIHSEALSYVHGFFPQKFSIKYGVFLCFIFHYYAIDFNRS